MAPTQIGRALQELQIVWIAAHSPQAKGRIERVFGTAQDRLVKGMRLARVSTLEQANGYLEQEFLPWWNQNLTVVAASAADAHRPLDRGHDLASALSHVETRQIGSDYTIRVEGRMYQIARSCLQAGMRGGTVRVEIRLDGSMAVRFRDRWVQVSECELRPKRAAAPSKNRSARPAAPTPRTTTAQRTAAWRASNHDLFKPGRSAYAAAAANRTRLRDTLD